MQLPVHRPGAAADTTRMTRKQGDSVAPTVKRRGPGPAGPLDRMCEFGGKQ